MENDLTATHVMVPSDRDPSQHYAVEIRDGQVWWCACRDWQYRRPEGGCKHMRAVQQDLFSLREMLEEIGDGL